MADVGDVNPDLEAAAGQLLSLDRIVMIAGILGIHSENQPAAEIFAVPDLAGGDPRGRGLRLGEHGRRELIADRVLRQDRKQFRPRLVGGAEDGRHLPDDGLPGSREAADTNFDEISRPRSAGREQDFARPLPVPDGDGPFGGHQSDDRGGTPLDDPQDGPLEPSAPGSGTTARRRRDRPGVPRPTGRG